MDTVQLAGRARPEKGKGASRKLRRAGGIPAILYGPDIEPLTLSIDYHDFVTSLKGRPAENVIFDLRIESDGKGQSKEVMIKELQSDPVTRNYLHIDFCGISMEKEIEATVLLNLVHTPIGVTKGGLLEHIRRELSVVCLPRDLVDMIEIDVSGLDIGDALHIGDIAIPPGLRSTEDEDLTIATVVPPTITAEAEEGEEEGVEGTESEEIGENEEPE
jgi:large subunit ribosomal protein L25